MAAQSLSPEMTNFARLVLAIKDVCTKCLIDVLQHNVPPKDIKQAIIHKWGHQSYYSEYPLLVLYPNHQLDPKFSVSNCDFTLVYFLIRNLTSVMNGLGNPVMIKPRNTSIGANVERLHQLRNEVIHLKKPILSIHDFNSKWSRMRIWVTDIDTYLGGTTYHQKLDTLKTADMDPGYANRIIEKFFRIQKDVLARQLALEQTLSDMGEKISHDIETTGDLMIEKISEVNVEIKADIEPIATNVQEIRELVEGMAKGKDRTQPQVNTTSNQDTNGGEEIGDLASGLDGKLCITKQYAFIKSDLTRESGLAIAKCLLDQKLLSQDAYDEMGNTLCARRHLIDKLLKKIIHGSEEEIVEAFFKRLKVECPSIARVVKETKITEEDRSRFEQFDSCRRKLGFSFGILGPGNSQHDVNFFKYHLCASKEVVEYIADVMLSRLNFSILDHCSILDYPRSEDMISALFQKMHLYNLDVVSELQGVVKLSLYQTWMEFRSAQGSYLSRIIEWIMQSKSVIDGIFKSEQIELTKVERGSIILKFIAGEKFSVDVLKPESLKKKIKTLLKRGCLESKTEPRSVAHTTVFIESSPKEDREEIHIYINFPATDVSMETEDHQAELRIRNKGIMLEEMNPARLKKWILDQPCIEKTHRDKLESKLSEQGLLRQEEMTTLLDFINGLQNGDHLLERYCETNDPYVYNKVFGKHQESISQQEEIPGHRAAVTYVKGGGLQKLFSFSIIFNDEDIYPDTEEASAGSMPSPPTSDTDRFMCIAYLLVDVGTRVLRQLLSHHTVTPTCTLDQYLAKNLSTISSSKRVFNHSHMDIMFPPNGEDTNLDDYDITLLCALFQNIVSTLSQQEVNMIRSLREVRNKVYCHALSCKINANDFQTYWNDISPLLTTLCQVCGDTAFEAKILQEIQHCQVTLIHAESYKLKTSIEMIESVMNELQMVLTRQQVLESNTSEITDRDLEEDLQKQRESTPVVKELKGTQQGLAGAMSSPPISDTDRFMRIAYLLVDVGSRVLRQLLRHHTVTPTCTLDQYLAKNLSTIISRRRIFNQSQIDIMFPPHGVDTNLDDYDITLLYALCQNIVPTLSQLEKDMLKRLREERNHLYGHAKSCRINANDFQTYWNDISSLLTTLSQLCGDTAFEAEILQEIERTQSVGIGVGSHLELLKTWFDKIESLNVLQNICTRQQALESKAKSSEELVQNSLELMVQQQGKANPLEDFMRMVQEYVKPFPGIIPEKEESMLNEQELFEVCPTDCADVLSSENIEI